MLALFNFCIIVIIIIIFYAIFSVLLIVHIFSSPWQLTRQILRQEGVPGLFHGLTSTWLREMPGYFVFFGGYEYFRSFLAQPGQGKDDIGERLTFLRPL